MHNNSHYIQQQGSYQYAGWPGNGPRRCIYQAVYPVYPPGQDGCPVYPPGHDGYTLQQQVQVEAGIPHVIDEDEVLVGKQCTCDARYKKTDLKVFVIVILFGMTPTF